MIDTAGRLAIDDELMDELASIKKVANPDELFYVADAMTGMDAVRTAQTFKDKIGITGVVLSKFDGDSKGGVAMGIAHQVWCTVTIYLGAGEKDSLTLAVYPLLGIWIPGFLDGVGQGGEFGEVPTWARRKGTRPNYLFGLEERKGKTRFS